MFKQLYMKMYANFQSIGQQLRISPEDKEIKAAFAWMKFMQARPITYSW